jgi:hypothetical protein
LSLWNFPISFAQYPLNPATKRHTGTKDPKRPRWNWGSPATRASWAITEKDMSQTSYLKQWRANLIPS